MAECCPIPAHNLHFHRWSSPQSAPSPHQVQSRPIACILRPLPSSGRIIHRVFSTVKPADERPDLRLAAAAPGWQAGHHHHHTRIHCSHRIPPTTNATTRTPCPSQTGQCRSSPPKTVSHNDLQCLYIDWTRSVLSVRGGIGVFFVCI